MHHGKAGTAGHPHPFAAEAVGECPERDLAWNGDGTDVGRGGRKGTCPVASFASGATPLGVFDLAGNVAEWISDKYGAYPTKAVSDPSGPSSGSTRVTRGSTWSEIIAFRVRSAQRANEAPSLRYDNRGIRCARSGKK